MKRITKIFGTVFIFFFFLVICVNHIEAKDIEIVATKMDEDLIFPTYIGSDWNTANSWLSYYGRFDSSFDYQFKRFFYNETDTYKPEGEAYRSDSRFINKYDNAFERLTPGHVGSNSYVIHNKPFSIYDSIDCKNDRELNGKKYGYIEYNNHNNSQSNVKYKSTNITGENTDVNYIEFDRFTNGYQIIEKSGSRIFAANNKLVSNYLEILKKDINRYKATEDSEGYYCYISEPLAFYFYEEHGGLFKARRSVVNTDGSTSNKVVGFLKAYDCVKNGDYPAYFGEGGNNGHSKWSSFINYYDNKLYLPKNALGNNCKVYVQHIDSQTGKNILGDDGRELFNESEILLDNGNASELSYSQFADANESNGEFPEYYEISTGQTLRVNRLMDIVKNGKVYKLKNQDCVKVSKASTYEEAKINLDNNSQPDTKTYVDVTAGEEEEVTLVSFIYDKVDVPSYEPESGVKTLDYSDPTANCQMSYTPTGEDIYPYLVANKFKLEDLKYKFEKYDNGKINYKISTFNVFKLESGTIANNTDKEGDLGRIFGGANDKWTLFEGNNTQADFYLNEDSSIQAFDDFSEKYGNVTNLPTYSNLESLFKKESRDGKKYKTGADDFVTPFFVPVNRFNGLRRPKLIANYKEYNVLEKTYGSRVENDDTSNTSNVLVYNPIKVTQPTLESSNEIIDHSTGNDKNLKVIQKNADFSLSIKKPNTESDTVYSSHTYYDYLGNYYLIFDFDVIQIASTEYDSLYIFGDNESNLQVLKKQNEGYVIKKGTIIKLSKDTETFKAKAGGTDDDSDVIAQDENTITLIASSINMPLENNANLLKYVLYHQSSNTIYKTNLNNYISTTGDNSEFTTKKGASGVAKKDYCDANISKDFTDYQVHDKEHYNNTIMYGDAYYFAKFVSTTKTVGRIYDFKVTDCSDVDYKSVFRKSDTGTINDLTKIQYFSGIKELKIFTKNVNTLEYREIINIGNNGAAKTILPLGPYKNTNISYVSAPKIGYRISFDLKTSGYFKYDKNNQQNSKRKIVIKPSYYYISKDGNNFVENVTLYYKGSDGKYKQFLASDYTIYFKPNDGYRNTLNESVTRNIEYMSTQLEKLVIGSSNGFELDHKMMSTSGNSFIQTWYGEFKLPNSTILVGGGKSISDHLKDGYVGVKFDISCIDTDSSGKEQIISYNVDNKNASPNTNTSQWDYEGYLGFNDPGKEVDNLTLQLEKGIWKINNDTYKKVKGTVVLFDLDNRAANDFD